MDLADPDIGKKHSQKDDDYTTVQSAYLDTELCSAPAIAWNLASNNELATRDRINEFLTLNQKYKHPITDESPAPRIFYLMFDREFWPNGVDKLVTQTKMQRRKLLGSDNGKNIYSIERDDNIVDHAYDTERYYVAYHAIGMSEEKKKPPRMSFAYYKAMAARRKYLNAGF